jgi:hypothetical protein
LAQQFEIGGLVGYGFYRAGTVFGPGVSAQAGIRNRFAAGFVACEDLYEHISGEIRYLYQDGHPFLSSGAVTSEIQGESHSLHYNLLIHLNPREQRFRPYVAGGFGGKFYMTSGPAPFPEPLPNLAALTNQDEWRLLVVVGGGVKYRLFRNVMVRGEFLDYMTTFPKSQIAPAPGNTSRGIFQQFTPLFGVSYVFH